MKIDWSTSNVLVTGASSGIGMAIAQQLAPRVQALILVARREDRLAALREQMLRTNPSLKVFVFACDITHQADVERLIRECEEGVGTIDVLVNNAGMGDIGFFETSEWAKLEQMIALNITALTSLTRRLVEPMIQRKRGGILMVSSTAGLQTTPGLGVYSATKSYVNGFSEALRAELSVSNITVSQLCPGPVATEFLSVAERSPLPISTKFLEISAEQCAREAIKGFESGRAVIIPGLLPKVLFFFHRFIPQIMIRGALRLVARQLSNLSRKSPRGV